MTKAPPASAVWRVDGYPFLLPPHLVEKWKQAASGGTGFWEYIWKYKVLCGDDQQDVEAEIRMWVRDKRADYALAYQNPGMDPRVHDERKRLVRLEYTRRKMADYLYLVDVGSALIPPAKGAILCAKGGIRGLARRGVRCAPTRITPSSLNARSIVEDARLHRMWEGSIRELYGGSGRTGRALREYLNVVEAGGTPTATQARNAFNSVRASFARRVEAAVQAGEAFPGYSFECIHHWNWHMADDSFHALAPRQLFPVTQDLHELIHLRTTIGPVETPLDIYFQPINPLHRMDLDMSYPLAPR